MPEDEGGGGGVLEDKARVPAPVVCAGIEAMSRDVNEPVRWQSAVDSDGGGGGGGEEEEEELLRVVVRWRRGWGAYTVCSGVGGDAHGCFLAANKAMRTQATCVRRMLVASKGVSWTRSTVIVIVLSMVVP